MVKFKINISLNGENKEFTCVNHHVYHLFRADTSYNIFIFYCDGKHWVITIETDETLLESIIKYFETDRIKHYPINSNSVRFEFPIEEFDMQTFLRPRIIK